MPTYHSAITVDGICVWLRSQDTTMVLHPNDVFDCPIRRYMQSIDNATSHVDLEAVYINGDRYDLPEWAQEWQHLMIKHCRAMDASVLNADKMLILLDVTLLFMHQTIPGTITMRDLYPQDIHGYLDFIKPYFAAAPL